MRNYNRVDYATGIASIRAMLGGAIADWAKKYITKDPEREDYRDQLIAEYVRLDLDPMSGLIIGDVRNDRDKGPKMNPYVTIGGMVVLADRFGRYGGIVPTSWQYRGDDPLPFACTAGVIRKDFDQPTIITRRFNEVAQKYRNSGDLAGQWPERPETMLEKSTLAVAFKFAFPSEMENMRPLDVNALLSSPRRALVAVPSLVPLPPPTAEEKQSAMVREHVAARNAAPAVADPEPLDPLPADPPEPLPADPLPPEPPPPETPAEPLATPEHVSRLYKTLGIALKGANHADIIDKVAIALKIPTPEKWGNFTAAQLDDFMTGYERAKKRMAEMHAEAAQAEAKANELAEKARAADATRAQKPPKGQQPLSKLQRSAITMRALDFGLDDARLAAMTRDISSGRTENFVELTADEALRLIGKLNDLFVTAK